MKRFILTTLLVLTLALPAYAQQCTSQDCTNATGGHELLTGDMTLIIRKEVSTNNRDFTETLDPEEPFRIRENADNMLYFRTRITNKGEVTATKIRLGHDFDEGINQMQAEDPVLLSDHVTYDEVTHTFRIDEITVGQTVSFTYTVLVHESGNSPEAAVDRLTLLSYDNKLPVYHDGMTHLGIGEFYSTYLGTRGFVKGATSLDPDGDGQPGSPRSPGDGSDTVPPPDKPSSSMKLAPTGVPSGVLTMLLLGAALIASTLNLKKRLI